MTYDRAAGNIANGSFTVTVVDTTAPVLMVPDDIVAIATSSSGAVVSFAASARDLVDPDPAITYSQDPGTLFPLGTTTVTVTATDFSGNSCEPQSFNVTVRYSWSGLLQPIKPDGTSVFKLGSTVPVKFQLTDDSAGIPDATVRLYVQYLGSGTMSLETEAVSSGSANTDCLFRYDPVADQYIYNLSTKGLTNGTYALLIDFGDGNLVLAETIGLRK